MKTVLTQYRIYLLTSIFVCVGVCARARACYLLLLSCGFICFFLYNLTINLSNKMAVVSWW